MWNCRGLGNLHIEKELGVLDWAKDPSILFIVETWKDEIKLKYIKRNLEFDHVFVVPRNNRGGGLDRKSTRLNSSHQCLSRMPSSA